MPLRRPGRESITRMDRRDFLKRAAMPGVMLGSGLAGVRPISVAPAPGLGAVMSTTAFSRAGLNRIHDRMAGYVNREEIPGIVALVSRKGKLYIDAIGSLSLGGEASLRRDAIFRIASLSKPIIAAATMILVEDGKLRLDESVDHLLPELAHRRVLQRLDGPLDETVPAKRAITTRDLLTFTWGFGILHADPNSIPVLKAANDVHIGMGPPHPDDFPVPDEWVRRLGTLPLMRQPGDMWIYNTAADVLSVLIGRATGQALEQFLRERIFDPLGMKDTGFSVPADKIDRFTTAYSPNLQTGKLDLYDSAVGGQWSHPPRFCSGAGGLVSTMDDYLAFSEMMRNNGLSGSKRIISSASVQAMTRDQLTPAQKSVSGLTPGYFGSHGWGFGISVVTYRSDSPFSVGTFGWDGGLGTSWRYDPEEDLTCILMAQRAWTSPAPPKVCLDFWAAAYESIGV
jgi:CubicO group peptidase (beta-lactamase class C family)